MTLVSWVAIGPPTPLLCETKIGTILRVIIIKNLASHLNSNILMGLAKEWATIIFTVNMILVIFYHEKLALF